MGHVLITGGTGLVGSRLTELLRERGHLVSHLGRTRREGDIPSFTWNINNHQIDPDTLSGVDTIVHLAGAGIADKPWTPQRKKEIRESRTASTQLLYDELSKGGHAVRTFISASAIGYYGFENPDVTFSENSPPGSDFLATVTARWEDEVDHLEELGMRVVKLRTGIVLSRTGGALEEIARPIRYYVGAPLGSGQQYLSWIHMDDLCALYVHAIDDGNMQGAYNAVAPTPVTNREITRAIAKAIDKPLFLPPIPGFVLRFLLGEMANLVLKGNKVSAKKILSIGFGFRFSLVGDALRDIFDHK